MVDSSTPPIRTGGYEHPWSHKYVSLSNSTCVNNVHDQDFQLACVQTYLDSVLHDCVGVGGQKGFSEECEGIGNRGPGGASGGFGGIGAELKRHDGGKGWRIEEGGDRKGGSGLDSSAESLGMEGIDRSRSGGIESEDCGIESEDCGNRLESCRVDFVDEKH